MSKTTYRVRCIAARMPALSSTAGSQRTLRSWVSVSLADVGTLTTAALNYTFRDTRAEIFSANSPPPVSTIGGPLGLDSISKSPFNWRTLSSIP
jgi:hypothetical protein